MCHRVRVLVISAQSAQPPGVRKSELSTMHWTQESIKSARNIQQQTPGTWPIYAHPIRQITINSFNMSFNMHNEHSE